METKKISLKTADGIKLVGIQLKPIFKTDKIIILCHGLTVDKDEGGIFVRLAEILANKGIASFRFDFRGHGKSGGRQEEMTIAGELTDLTAVFDFIKSKDYKRIGLLGASFGGGIVVLFSSFNQENVSSLVLWNPVLDYSSWIYPKNNWEKKYFGKQAIEKATKIGYSEAGSRKYKIGIKLFNEIRFFKPFEELKKFKKPLLFIHGDKDTYVDYQNSLRFSEMLKARLITVKSAEHGFQDKEEWRKKAIGETIKFFKRTCL